MEINMRYIKSCGAVVFTRQGNEILYVIIRQTNGDWGFPKGHTEQGETEQETALREIREEVGLRTELLPGFRKEITYPFPNKVDLYKQVVYFLAEYAAQTLACQPGEVETVLLLSYRQAMERLTFEETKNILTEADCFLKG